MSHRYLFGKTLSAISFTLFFSNTINGFHPCKSFRAMPFFHTRQSLPDRQSIAEEHSDPCAHFIPEKAAMTPVPVVHVSSVDYSAANEYVRARYNQSQYFGDLNDGSSVDQPFHDGRILQSCYDDDRRVLNDHGLAIIESPITKEPRWSELNDIQKYYLPELERIIHKLFPSKLLNYSFWNPMIRGESYEISRGTEGDSRVTETPTANVASLVHIDTDVGAYETIQEFLNIVEKNQVVQSPNTPDTNIFKNIANDIIHGNKRFAIINFWRNIGDAPVTSAPLAILSTRYDNEHHAAAFPNARPNLTKSKWHIFPNATRDEVIVFYQYDRNLKQPSDLWHCAVSTENSDPTKIQQSTSRTSFDIRALIVLDEDVPDELDRFSFDRTRPFLTFEESGCFCDEQAASRNME